MLSNSSSFEQEETLKFSGQGGFFDRNFVIRYFILFLFSLVLFCFLHFREIRMDSFELNSIAPHLIVSPVDFSFPDDQATLISRQNALRNVGDIYLISRKDIKKNQNGIANEKMERILSSLRFASLDTIEQLRQIGFPVQHYIPYLPSSENLKGALPQDVGKELGVEFPILGSVLEKGDWHFQEDKSSRKEIKKFLLTAIPEQMKQVYAGDHLVDQGQKVTARHLMMIQSMKAAVGENRHLYLPSTWLGTGILTILLTGIFFAYFRVNDPSFLSSNRKLFLLVTILTITLVFSKLAEFFLLNSRNSLLEFFKYPLFVPLSTILACSLINHQVALFSAGFLTIVSTIALAFEWEGILLLNMNASIVAILSTNTLRRRKEVFVVCFKAWLTCVATILAMHFYQNQLVFGVFLSDVMSAGFFMGLTAILVVGFLPLLESAFGVMTDVSLMEYMDPNHDLLRRLTVQAPGTYQHSVVVGNLAEAAALSIGANGLFCRVATLYHDIGKITTAQYFTENQSGGANIHDLLTPQESAQAIMSHISEGVVLAREAGLPELIIDIIKEHHGTTLVYYFYRKQLDKVGGDKSKVNEKDFRYSGPRPRSKESGIIMIADSFEAASRSLDEVNEKTLNELLERIIWGKLHDHQFDECLLSCEDLKKIQTTLVKTLLAAGHSRVKYPAEETKETVLA